MRRVLLGLLGSALWAQYAWDWTAEVRSEGSGEITYAGGVEIGSRLFARLLLQGDTLWVMGNSCLRGGDTLYLPSTDGPKSLLHNPNAPGGGALAVGFVVAYERLTGKLLGGYYAHADPSQAFSLVLRDFAVSEGGDTLWIAVDFPAGGCRSRNGNPSIAPNNTFFLYRWDPAAGSWPVSWSSACSYQSYHNASTAQLWQIAGSSATNLCLHWENNQIHEGLSLGLWSLVREPGILYVSGTVRRPNTSQSPVGSFNQPKMNAAFPPRGTQEPAIPFVLRVATGGSLSITQATCFYRTGSMMQGYGRSLIGKGDTLYFLIGLRGDVGAFSTLNAGWSEAALPFASLDLSSLSGPNARVLLLGLKKADLQPLTTGLLILNVEPLWAYDGSINPSPSLLYPVRVGDTLWLTWSDSRQSVINGSSYSGSQRVYLMAWTGMETFSPAPLNGPGSGVLWQSDQFSYAPGIVYHKGWVFLPLNRSNGGGSLGHFLWKGGIFHVYSPEQVLLGSPAPYWYGIAADRYGHLYGFGVGRNMTFRYHVLRGSGMPSSLITLANAYGTSQSGRGWVGRLLWYRWEGPTGTLSRCSPDTAGGPFGFTLYGRWEAGEIVRLHWGETSYRVRPAGTLRVSGDRPDSVQITAAALQLPGLAPGPSPLSVWTDWPVSLALFPLLPRLSFQVSDSSYAELHRQDTTEGYWVVPFLGQAQAGIGWRQASQSGPFPRQAARLDGEAGPSPHYAFAYVPFDPTLASEALYIAVNYSDSVLLYRFSFASGLVERYLGWPRSLAPSPSPQEVASHIEQLVYDPAWGRLLAIEGYRRLRAIPLVTPADSRPYLVPSTWDLSSTITADKAHPFQVEAGNRGELWIGGLEAYSSLTPQTRPILAVETFSSPSLFTWVGDDIPGCPAIADGDMNTARIASLRGLAVARGGSAKAYFVDWGRRTGCSTPPRLYLRKVTGTDEIVTIDSLWTGSSWGQLDSVRVGLLWQGQPAEHLLLTLMDPTTGQGYLLRYWLDGRPTPRDTLVGPVHAVSDCGYGYSRRVTLAWPKAPSLAKARGGVLLYSAVGEIRAALPLYVKRPTLPDTTRWTLSQPLTANATSPRPVDLQSSPGSGRLRWAADSLRSGYDSLWIEAPLCGSSSAAARFLVPSYTLPAYLTHIDAPSTVCQGQLFHAKVGFGGDEFHHLILFEAGLPQRCGLERLFAGLTWAVDPPNKVQQLHARVNTDVAVGIMPTFARFAVLDSCSSCEVRLGMAGATSPADSAFSRAFFGGETWSKPITFRRGHQLKVRVLLEGPAARQSGLRPMGAHPLFTRENLLLSQTAASGPLGDSLWLLPLNSDGAAGPLWDRIGGEAYPSDTASAPTRWKESAWVSPCRVELRESPDGPPVGSAWGLVDTAGWIWAFTPPLVDSTDAPAHPLRSFYRPRRLSFCQCDTTTPKWIVVRFPHHLLLRSAGPLSLSNGLLSNDPANPTVADLTDPSGLDGIPGEHYTLVPDPAAPGTYRAAAWAGNCDDAFHSDAYPGQTPPDASRINAADYEFLLPRNGITGPAFTPADLDADGYVNAADLLLLIPNMNALRQGITE